MKVGPFHSQQGDTARYHNNNQCPVGGKIISTDRARGRGGYPLCEQCRLLRRDRKAVAQPAVRPVTWLKAKAAVVKYSK